MKRTIISSGRNGTVYRIPGNKVLKIDFDREKCAKNNEENVRINNVIASVNLAPRVYSVSVRPDGCHVVMDYTTGTNLYKLIHKGSMTKDILKRVFAGIRLLHKNLPNGHGDMNYGNVLYSPDTKKVTFIDFTVAYGNYNTRDAVLDYWQMLFYANKNNFHLRMPYIVPDILAEIGKEYAARRTSFDIDLDFRLRYLFIFITHLFSFDNSLYYTLFSGKSVLNEDLLRYLVFFSHHREACVKRFNKFFQTFIVKSEVELGTQAFTDLDDFVMGYARE